MMIAPLLSLPPIAPLAVSRAALIVANADTSINYNEEHLIWTPSFAPQFAAAATTFAIAAFAVEHSPLAQQPHAWYPLYDNLFVRTGLSSVAGLLSSSCCLLQIMLNALSVGCAGFNTVLGPVRPYFMALALTLQGLMWQAVFAEAAPIEPALQSTALTLCLTFLPEALDAAMQASAVPPAEDDLRLRVGGMGCTACSVKVKAALEGVDGVSACTVVFEEGCAQLQLDSSSGEERAAVEQRAIAALAEAGFEGAAAQAAAP